MPPPLSPLLAVPSHDGGDGEVGGTGASRALLIHRGPLPLPTLALQQHQVDSFRPQAAS